MQLKPTEKIPAYNTQWDFPVSTFSIVLSNNFFVINQGLETIFYDISYFTNPPTTITFLMPSTI